MTDPTDSSPEDTATDAAEALRVEAAGWFARMRREDSARFRPQFEAWLSEAGHRAAYNRIATRFTDAKILHQRTASPTAQTQPLGRNRRTAPLAAAAAVLVLVVITGTLAPRFGWNTRDAPPSVARLEAVKGGITRFRLRDGSVVTLDGDSLVTVRLDGQGRELRLEQGRARFAVAHETRPFIVRAADGQVAARGTIFDVALIGGVADIALIEGAVDVTASPGAAGKSQVERLEAGERVALARGRISGKPGFAPRAAPDWPRSIADVRDITLDALLDRANRLSVIQLTAAPDIAQTRLSGRFRLDDPLHLAANLARLLALRQHKDGARIMLDRHDTDKKFQGGP